MRKGQKTHTKFEFCHFSNCHHFMASRASYLISYNCIIVHVMSSILVYSDSKTHIEYQLHGTECVDGVDIEHDPSG